MNFRCKFRHRRSIRRPRFSIRVQNFGDLASFPLIFAFYMLNVRHISTSGLFDYWPRRYITRDDPTSIILTKFEVDMTIRCRVIAFLSADTARDLVTLTFDLLTLNSCPAWRVTWPTLPPSMKTLRRSVLELRVITFPVGYHWKCVRGHCACTESRDPWVGVINHDIFGMLDPDLPIHCATSVALRWK